ncbi:alpha/beta fold hydrolase [Luteimonas salinilitoris]|uniref:Alpha/beta fold hydrolase n=1 Tax=Luteimonas salinilitoris TaxID=3237697 RepID=A0ABV4HU61_9GAMM
MTEPSAVSSGYADVDGLDVYYEVHGGPLRPGLAPFVLLHGGAMAIETAFAGRLLPQLAALRPVIAIEQQGHGHTADRADAPSITRMVEDTAGVLDHLGVGRAHLVGHSLGGMIATGMAILRPDRTESATIMSATYVLEGMLPDIVAVQRDPTHQPSPETAALFPTEADFGAWVEHYNRVAPDPAAFEPVLGKLNTMLAEWSGWSQDQLRAIQAPSLLVIGDTDFVRIEHAAEMARLIPGCRLAVLPGTTHMNITDRGDWIVPMIQDRIATRA